MTEQSSTALDRRTLLKRGAVVGAATVWTIPVVQAFSMSPAGAATPSGSLPTTPVPPPHTTTPVEPPSSQSSSGIDPTTIHHVNPTTTTATTGSHGVDATTSHQANALASTGPAVPIGEALMYGAGAVAVGVAAVAAGQRRNSAAHATGAPRPRPRPHTPEHH